VHRVDCAADGCRDGCLADETAIGAFCAPNTAPSPEGDRNVRCTAADNSKTPPTMLICAKK